MGQEQRQRDKAVTGRCIWRAYCFHSTTSVPCRSPAQFSHPRSPVPSCSNTKMTCCQTQSPPSLILVSPSSSSASRALPQLVPRPHPGLSLSSCSQPGLSLTSGRKPQQTPMEGLGSSRGRAGYIISGTQNKKKMTAFCILYVLFIF